VDMVGHPCSGRLAQVHTEVKAVRAVDLAQTALNLLRNKDHLLGGFGRERGERVEMLVGNDKYVPGRIRESIKAHETERATVDDMGSLFSGFARHAVGDGVVGGGDQVAEDAVLVLRSGPTRKCGGYAGAGLRVCSSDVVIAPGSPETIHKASIRGEKIFIRSCARMLVDV